MCSKFFNEVNHHRVESSAFFLRSKCYKRCIKRSASLVVRIIGEIARDESDSSRILPLSHPLSSHPFVVLPGSWRSRQRLVDLHLVISRPSLRCAESRRGRRRRRSTTPPPPPFRHFLLFSIHRVERSLSRPCLPACLPATRHAR